VLPAIERTSSGVNVVFESIPDEDSAKSDLR
jgi:hypothetical protein